MPALCLSCILPFTFNFLTTSNCQKTLNRSIQIFQMLNAGLDVTKEIQRWGWAKQAKSYVVYQITLVLVKKLISLEKRLVAAEVTSFIKHFQ